MQTVTIAISLQQNQNNIAANRGPRQTNTLSLHGNETTQGAVCMIIIMNAVKLIYIQI